MKWHTACTGAHCFYSGKSWYGVIGKNVAIRTSSGNVYILPCVKAKR